MASSESQMTDLQDQINLTTAQLESLDENDVEYAVTKMVLEHGLASLQEQYEAAERAELGTENGTNIESGQENGDLSLPIVGSQHSHISDVNTRPSNGFASYAGIGLDTFGGQLASDGVEVTHFQPDPWSFSNLDEMGTNSEATTVPAMEGRSMSGSASSPDSSFVRPQKRPRESIGLSSNPPGHPHKYMRTTPSPAMTASTTPTSTSSFELPNDPDLLTLLGGNPAQDLRDMREEQKEQEKALEAKRQQERLDEEFARQLMEQENDTTPFGGSSRPDSSLAPRSTSQTILDSRGRYRRPTPFPVSSPATVKTEDPFSTTSLPAAAEDPYLSQSVPVKNENFRWPDNSATHSSDFIDLESDEFFNQQLDSVGSHPSSDLVEIDSTAFAGDNRQSQALPLLNGNHNSYGKLGDAGPSSWGYSGGQLGQSIANTASNLWNGAYNLLDQQIGDFGNIPTGFGGASVYGSNGQGSSTDIIDLESYDESSYFRDDLFSWHGISAEDPANTDLVASFRDRVDYVTNDPTRTSEEIKSLLENIRPDEDLPPENREGTPEAMTYPLMEHQKLGLAWMKSMEEGSNKGGILADGMGLGKTIQALALMVSQKSSDRACKTTLIVCPVALLKQWDREITTKLKPDHQLKVYTLHSEKRHVQWAKLRTFDIVLTTFGRAVLPIP